MRLLRMLAVSGPNRLAGTGRRMRDWGEELRTRDRRARLLVARGIAAAWAGVWAGAFDPHRPR